MISCAVQYSLFCQLTTPYFSRRGQLTVSVGSPLSTLYSFYKQISLGVLEILISRSRTLSNALLYIHIVHICGHSFVNMRRVIA
jgi:hypothetical protein